nr:MAG: hypothetical protein [Chemarfal virus 40]
MSNPRPLSGYLPLNAEPDFLIVYIEDYLNQLTPDERYDTSTIYSRTLVHLFGDDLQGPPPRSGVGVIRELVEDLINSIIRVPFHAHLQRTLHPEAYRQVLEHFRNRARRLPELNAEDLLFTTRLRRTPPIPPKNPYLSPRR